MKSLIDRVMASKFPTWDDAQAATRKIWPRRIYSVSARTVYDDPHFTVLESSGTRYRCGIVWDEDRDERVVAIVEAIFSSDLESAAWLVGERKGNVQIIGDIWPRLPASVDPPDWVGGSRAADAAESLEELIGKATEHDPWPVNYISCRREVDPAWFESHFAARDFGMGRSVDRWKATHAEMMRVVDYFGLGDAAWIANAPPPMDWKGADSSVAL